MYMRRKAIGLLRRWCIPLLMVTMGGVLGCATRPPAVKDVEALYTPTMTATDTTNRVPLRQRPENGLLLIQAALEGVPCTLLFDTGATHTTFDRDFIERTFPNKALAPVQLEGETNVASAPECFQIDTLTLGNTTLSDFRGMTLPMKHLSEAIGEHVDGILGMNAMAYAPFLLEIGKGAVTWYAEGSTSPKGIPLPVLPTNDNHVVLIAKTSPEGATFPLLMDSGASFSVFPETLWPKEDTEDGKAFSATDINATESNTYRKGKDGALYLGKVRVRVHPLVLGDETPLLGVDTLRKMRLLVDGKQKRVTLIP